MVKVTAGVDRPAIDRPGVRRLRVRMLACALGCLPARGIAQPVAHVRDSAGVHIVEYDSLPSRIRALQHERDPWLVLGQATGTHPMVLQPHNPLLSPTWLANGNMVVNDLTGMKVFDQAGHFIREFGEIPRSMAPVRQIRTVCRLPEDSVLAIEYGSGRITLWSPSGTFVRETVRRSVTASDPCLPDGTVLVMVNDAARSALGPAAAGEDRFARMRSDGSVVGDQLRFPSSEYGRTPRETNIIAASARIYVASGQTYEIRSQSMRGRLLFILRVRHLGELDPTGPLRRNASSSHATYAPPAPFPAYRRVHVDASGRLWVQAYDRRQRWIVFNGSGGILGELVVEDADAARTTLAAVAANQFVLLRDRSNGHAELEFYRLP
jgi:hypothetical protein